MIVAFAEEICHSGDIKRPSGKEVVFRVKGFGKIDGYHIDFDLRASYDIWYDSNDDVIVEALKDACPGIWWDRFVFWKKFDHSEIGVFDPSTDKQVGSIKVRKRMIGKPENWDMTNVVQLGERK